MAMLLTMNEEWEKLGIRGSLKAKLISQLDELTCAEENA